MKSTNVLLIIIISFAACLTFVKSQDGTRENGMKARAKSFTIWSDNTRQPVVRMKRNPTPEGGDVVPPTKKKRTYGWAYEATLPKCEGARPPGKWKIPDIKAVGKKKKCNRGKNIGEEREKAKQYLLKQLAEQ